MICGIGIDILDSRRIAYLLNKFGNHFENKYFTDNEIQFCKSKNAICEDNSVTNKYNTAIDKYSIATINSFAKIFSIKESVIKAISNKSGMTWHSTEVLHNELGKPIVRVYCDTYGNIPNNKYSIHVSTSDEKLYIVSMAIIEYNI